MNSKEATAVLFLDGVEKSGHYFGFGVGVGRWTETWGVLVRLGVGFPFFGGHGFPRSLVFPMLL